MKTRAPKAREALAEMVFERNGFEGLRTSKILANYLEMMKSTSDIPAKLEARELLRLSDNVDFVGRVLNVIAGVPIDGELLEQLEECLQSQEYYMRWKAAAVVATSKGFTRWAADNSWAV